jgi:hypothetical protein
VIRTKKIKKPVKRRCVFCGKLFTTRTAWARFCSGGCRNKAWYLKEKGPRVGVEERLRRIETALKIRAKI